MKLALAFLTFLATWQDADKQMPPKLPPGTLLFVGETESRFPVVQAVPPKPGGESITLSEKWGAAFEPVLSPDGRSVAFVRFAGSRVFDDFATEVCVVDLDNPLEVNVVSRETAANTVRWSPDGRKLAYAINFPDSYSSAKDRVGREFAQIITCHRDGTRRDVVERGFSPSWSCDGKELLFIRMNHHGTRMATIHLKIGRLTTIGAGAGAVNAAWSPDGKRIAFVKPETWSSRGLFDGDFDLYVMETGGADVRRLTSTVDDKEVAPNWSADGTAITFSRSTNNEFGPLYTIDPSTGEEARVSPEGKAAVVPGGLAYYYWYIKRLLD